MSRSKSKELTGDFRRDGGYTMCSWGSCNKEGTTKLPKGSFVQFSIALSIARVSSKPQSYTGASHMHAARLLALRKGGLQAGVPCVAPGHVATMMSWEGCMSQVSFANKRSRALFADRSH